MIRVVHDLERDALFRLNLRLEIKLVGLAVPFHLEAVARGEKRRETLDQSAEGVVGRRRDGGDELLLAHVQAQRHKPALRTIEADSEGFAHAGSRSCVTVNRSSLSSGARWRAP